MIDLYLNVLSQYLFLAYGKDTMMLVLIAVYFTGISFFVISILLACKGIYLILLTLGGKFWNRHTSNN